MFNDMVVPVVRLTTVTMYGLRAACFRARRSVFHLAAGDRIDPVTGKFRFGVKDEDKEDRQVTLEI